MTQIYFFIRDTEALSLDEGFRHYAEWHYWKPKEDSEWVFGVCIPRGLSPQATEQKLKSFGAQVLPGINHPNPPELPDHVAAALAPHGVKKNHRTHEVAEAMHKASGCPALEPNYH